MSIFHIEDDSSDGDSDPSWLIKTSRLDSLPFLINVFAPIAVIKVIDLSLNPQRIVEDRLGRR